MFFVPTGVAHGDIFHTDRLNVSTLCDDISTRCSYGVVQRVAL